MGNAIVCDNTCLDQVQFFHLLSCDESIFPGWENPQGGDLWQLYFLGGWEDLCLGRQEELGKSLYLYLLILKYLQLKLIFMPECHILGCHFFIFFTSHISNVTISTSFFFKSYCARYQLREQSGNVPNHQKAHCLTIQNYSVTKLKF